jgi:Na+-transporting NADH:ubiquinone oxidoreductase subunit NqrB
MYPTQLHSYMLWRSSVEPSPPALASKRFTAAVSLIPAVMVGIIVYGWYAGLVMLTCVTSAFVALMLPPAMPLYLAAAGSIIAVLAGKYLMQVDGMPLFQPALLGLLSLHILCPLIMALGSGNPNATMNPRDRWPVLARSTSIETTGAGKFVPKFLLNFFGGDIRNSVDAKHYASDVFANKVITTEAKTGSRPQDLVAAVPSRDLSNPDVSADGATVPCDWLQLLLGYLPAVIGGSQGLALIMGALLMFFSRSTSPLISVSALATMLAGLLLFAWTGNGEANARVVYGNIPIHLLSGGTLLAIFYFACDPAVTPRSSKGKIYAGVFFGIIELTFRLIFKVSDGLPVSILATQAMSFVIDQWLAPPPVSSASAVHIGISQSSLGRL